MVRWCNKILKFNINKLLTMSLVDTELPGDSGGPSGILDLSDSDSHGPDMTA